ncbi:MAG: hypothetical protein ACK504_09160 [Bacteroidota bacterium]
MTKHESRHVTGGYSSSSCGPNEVETMGSPNTFVDTPSDCGVDPDTCEDILVRSVAVFNQPSFSFNSVFNFSAVTW